MSFLSKINFIFNKPRITVVARSNQELIRKIVGRILGYPFGLKQRVIITDIKGITAPPDQGYLILDYDDENIRELREKTSVKVSTFGFQSGADFQATDIKVNGGTNFKINYRGSIVPIWLEKPLSEEQIYPFLATIAVGTILGLNLVEISQFLKGLTAIME